MTLGRAGRQILYAGFLRLLRQRAKDMLLLPTTATLWNWMRRVMVDYEHPIAERVAVISYTPSIPTIICARRRVQEHIITAAALIHSPPPTAPVTGNTAAGNGTAAAANTGGLEHLTITVPGIAPIIVASVHAVHHLEYGEDYEYRSIKIL